MEALASREGSSQELWKPFRLGTKAPPDAAVPWEQAALPLFFPGCSGDSQRWWVLGVASRQTAP